MSNPVFCTDSAWQWGLKEDAKAQDMEEVPRSMKSIFSGDIQDPPEQGPVQLAVVDPALAGGLD